MDKSPYMDSPQPQQLLSYYGVGFVFNAKNTKSRQVLLFSILTDLNINILFLISSQFFSLLSEKVIFGTLHIR